MLFTAYIGSNNVAHRITKAYVGDSTGKARCMYNPVTFSDQITYDSIKYLSDSRTDMGTAQNSSYAFLAGGSSKTTVDIFNKALTKSTITSLTSTYVKGTNLGDIIVFASTSIVEYYNSNLVHSIAENLSETRSSHAISHTTNYVLVAGGYIGTTNSSRSTNTVDAYNQNLVHSVVNNTLNYEKHSVLGVSIGEYALFGGGQHYDPYYGSYTQDSDVQSFNDSLVKTGVTSFGYARQYASATSNKNYAIFGSGAGNSNASYMGDAYDVSLTKSSCELKPNVWYQAAVSIGNGAYAAFAAGKTASSTNRSITTVDNNLIVSNPLNFYTTGYGYYGVSIGNYALIAGGSAASDKVYAYKYEILACS